MIFIQRFADIRLTDIGQVGGKNASLGQMIGDLSSQGICIPPGFAITADAYWYFIDANKLREPIAQLLTSLSGSDDLQKVSMTAAHIRELIVRAVIPTDLADSITQAYHELSRSVGGHDVAVAVRSSATAEDLPGASFAGQQESYLNVTGIVSLLEHCKQCWASLFTDRAIVYRQQKGFDHAHVALSIGVQKMVHADTACAGVAFSLDTETGFKESVMINAARGLGEKVVQGEIIPDEYIVHKPTLQQGYPSIIKKELGNTQSQFCLTDAEIVALAGMVLTIENYYSTLQKAWCPMDVEWAQDSQDKKLYIVQARPETVHAQQKHDTLVQYTLQHQDVTVLCTGQSIGQKIVTGTARIITSFKKSDEVQPGDIIVTTMTDPSWVPAMKRAAGIVTEQGGRTCHAAIVSRELGIPALVGVENATQKLTSGAPITLDCSKGSQGFIYKGKVAFEVVIVPLTTVPKLSVEIMLNCGDPAQAFAHAQLPVDGVGLARLEFIIGTALKVHPLALLHPERITDAAIAQEIRDIIAPYSDGKAFFVTTLAQSIGMIAAAFYPKPVVVRLSDLKSNEYRDLLGGRYFEPEEENPMLGWRGASRYTHPAYREAFALECAALVQARSVLGLKNIVVMVPFVRTINEAQRVIQELQKNGLEQGKDGLKIIMMVEIPANVILIDDFAKLFDGFSIGSNDLTQLTLGIDRDSSLVNVLFDERNPAVIKMFEYALAGAHKAGKSIGVCGQAPSDYPELGDWFIKQGVTSLSLNPDAVMSFLMRYAKK